MNKMKLNINSLDRTILFETNSEELYEYMKSNDFVDETIPAYSSSPSNDSYNFKLVLNNTFNNGNIDLDYTKKICNIEVDISKLYKPDLVYLILQIFSRLHEENNTYLIHAASVNYKGKSIILPGVPGSGKTGVAFAMLKNGGKYLSNDRALIRFYNDKPFVVGGTSCMHVRVPTIKEFLGVDINLPKNINKEDWNTKILLSKNKLEEIGFVRGESAEYLKNKIY